MDVTHYARFTRPGHAVTGDRSSTAAEKRAKVGYEHAHAIVDDHSRLAYAELLDDERAATVTAFVTRAFAFFAEHGVEPKRLMTDNAWSYTLNRSLQELLRERAVKRVRTPKRRPQPNGKVERFHQTMAREWAYGLRYRSSRHRAPHCHTGSPTTTSADRTARSATYPAQPRSQPVWAGQLAGRRTLGQGLRPLPDPVCASPRESCSCRAAPRAFGDFLGTDSAQPPVLKPM